MLHLGYNEFSVYEVAEWFKGQIGNFHNVVKMSWTEMATNQKLDISY
jgi:hypothetical protein